MGREIWQDDFSGYICHLDITLSLSLQPANTSNMHFIKGILVELQCPLNADQASSNFFLVTNVTNEQDILYHISLESCVRNSAIVSKFEGNHLSNSVWA